MDHVVRPRNVDGRIMAPPGYELRSDGLCYLVEMPAEPESEASAPVEQTIADALPIELPMSETKPSENSTGVMSFPNSEPESIVPVPPETPQESPVEPETPQESPVEPESPQEPSHADDDSAEHSET